MLFRPSKFASVASALVLATGAYLVSIETADARVGGGRSSGSRGAKTFSAPPATTTAPKAAAPMERTMTQPGRPAAAATGAGATAATQTSRFGGWGGLLMGGLIGAGLASMFGLGAMAGVLGFLLQMALIAGAIWLVMSFFRRRNPAMAGADASAAGRADVNLRQGMTGTGAGQQGGRAQGGGLGFGASAATAKVTAPLTLGQADFEAFERLLGDIQLAYGRGDIDGIASRATPEMLSYFAAQLHENSEKGLRNDVGAPKLLQGDLSEAWSEASGEYATVAMRYALTDTTIEIATGRVVDGNASEPVEVTEVWSFMRPRNGRSDQWELSAIQQA
jgi:predicted lipid-binding transport protein (Tim44 family)